MKGYKVFNSNFTCDPTGNKPFQFEVGKTFEEDVNLSVCGKGFHFCKEAKDCFNYYSFDPNNKVAEIEALGEIIEEGDKCCTNKISIVREIPWQEILSIVNTGKGCTGLCNIGDRNSGNRNSGDWNSGNRNSGNRNSGDWNSGDWNSGDRNSGNRNSGDWNKTSFSSGVFCTEQPKLLMFNKPTEITFEQWRNSPACRLLNKIDFRPTEWIWDDDMTEEEKVLHLECETTQGYLKKLSTKECCHDWWMHLTMDEKCIIQNMPNFDAVMFAEITGIQV